ncbi:MAG: hypothetical protein HQL08_11040 [Nitrospirae bacterium]|nr:hypothetical protein [Nitrospirota bacterium]
MKLTMAPRRLLLLMITALILIPSAVSFAGSTTYTYDDNKRVIHMQGGGQSSSGTPTIEAVATGNGSISPSGNISVTSGSSKTFSITPNINYYIADVQVDGVSQGPVNTYTFNNVTSDHTILAMFGMTTYNITASAGANGGVVPCCTVTVDTGGSQTYTFPANLGYAVSNVVVDGASIGAASSYTFSNVKANHTITAYFGVATITASAGADGSISPSGVVNVNSSGTQTFTITPNTAYVIADVKVDGASVGAVTTYTFSNVTANHTISASFAIKTYTLTAYWGNGGSITPSGTTTVNSGGSQAYAITPSTGYAITDVLIDGVSQGLISSYAFNNVTANHTISATFDVVVSSAAQTIYTGTQQSGYEAYKTFDGNNGTGCSLTGSGVVSIGQNFGSAVDISAVNVQRNSVGAMAWSGALQYSDNNINWYSTNVTNINVPYNNGTGFVMYQVNESGAHQYWRIQMTSGSYLQATEMQMVQRSLVSAPALSTPAFLVSVAALGALLWRVGSHGVKREQWQQ